MQNLNRSIPNYFTSLDLHCSCNYTKRKKWSKKTNAGSGHFIIMSSKILGKVFENDSFCNYHTIIFVFKVQYLKCLSFIVVKVQYILHTTSTIATNKIESTEMCSKNKKDSYLFNRSTIGNLNVKKKNSR